MSSRFSLLPIVLAVGLLLFHGSVLSASAAPPSADVTVEGPVSGSPYPNATFDIAGAGYSESEFFLSGTAHSFRSVEADAPYKTRIVVYRPLDARRFSGNVVVEWNNVSGFVDVPVDLQWVSRQVMDTGDAYVAVSVQQVGVCGPGEGGAPLAGVVAAPCTPLSLKGHDPARYAPLFLPDDDYAFDIYSQAARSLLTRQGVDPLGGLTPRSIVAIGVSQSALELDNYIKSGADDSARIFDGFLIDADSHARLPERYRVPTLHLWSEDAARPGIEATTENHVSWQIAGASHIDRWLLGNMNIEGIVLAGPGPITDASVSSPDNIGNYGQRPSADAIPCLGSEFPRRYAVDGALAAVQTWVRDGIAPPIAPPLEFTDLGNRLEGAPTLPDIAFLPVDGVNAPALIATPFTIARDEHGNAVGGVRLPVITVPVAGYAGTACVLSGITTALPSETLHALYPTHEVYVTELLDATRTSVRDRFTTLADGIDLIERACVSAIPAWGTTPVEQRPAACADIRGALTG